MKIGDLVTSIHEVDGVFIEKGKIIKQTSHRFVIHIISPQNAGWDDYIDNIWRTNCWHVPQSSIKFYTTPKGNNYRGL